MPLFYRDHQVGEYRLDFLVEGKIVVELKAINRLEDIHFAVGRSYLKAANLNDGLLFNFATAPLTINVFAVSFRTNQNVSIFLCDRNSFLLFSFPFFLLS